VCRSGPLSEKSAPCSPRLSRGLDQNEANREDKNSNVISRSLTSSQTRTQTGSLPIWASFFLCLDWDRQVASVACAVPTETPQMGSDRHEAPGYKLRRSTAPLVFTAPLPFPFTPLTFSRRAGLPFFSFFCKIFRALVAANQSCFFPTSFSFVFSLPRWLARFIPSLFSLSLFS